MHFLVVIGKLEVGCVHYFYFYHRGSPAEGSPTLQEIGSAYGKSHQIHYVPRYNTIIAIMLLPFPLKGQERGKQQGSSGFRVKKPCLANNTFLTICHSFPSWHRIAQLTSKKEASQLCPSVSSLFMAFSRGQPMTSIPLQPVRK